MRTSTSGTDRLGGDKMFHESLWQHDEWGRPPAFWLPYGSPHTDDSGGSPSPSLHSTYTYARIEI